MMMMKKILIIAYTSLFCLLTLSCSKEIEMSKLENRHGVFYEPNQEKPYTGKVLEYYDNGQKKVEGTFKDGKREGFSIFWDKNGQKQVEENFKDDKIE
jgi:antitoxin component YwqK of YwqJK toxin-antitoxin module